MLFKNVTQHIQDIKTIESNQEMLMEKERLAALGQMIGGIAHNLKTPIMSVAGAAEGLPAPVHGFAGDPDAVLCRRQMEQLPGCAVLYQHQSLSAPAAETVPYH